jgi:hypothetical protein
MSIDPKAFEPVFRQNWENARRSKSERSWSVNLGSVISARALSWRHTRRGGAVGQLARLILPCLFSLSGWRISLRLKVELECWAKLQALAIRVEPQRALRRQGYGSLAPSR